MDKCCYWNICSFSRTLSEKADKNLKIDKRLMAAYYPASSNERDYVPVNYSRELTPGSYSGAPVLPGTMMYMTYSSSSGLYPDTLVGNSQQGNTDISIPPVGVSDSTILHHEFLSNLGGSRTGEYNFTAWRDGRNEMLLMQPVEGDTSNLHGGQKVQGQGLSLSLSPQIPSGIQISSLQYGNHNTVASSFLSPNTSVSGENITFRDDETSQGKQSRNTENMQPNFQGGGSDIMKGDVSPYVMSNIARNIPNSKYLKAAQQLLDEVVNVRQALKQRDSKTQRGSPEKLTGFQIMEHQCLLLHPMHKIQPAIQVSFHHLKNRNCKTR